MNKPLHVTEHAIVRYLERVLHLDMDKIREDIRAEADAGRACAVPPIGGGVAIMGPRRKSVCIVQGNSIVTVLGVREIRRAAPWMGRFDA
jgi:hypothetical protein